MNNDERRGECKQGDASQISSIEVNFAIPVWLTQEQQRVLLELVSDIVEAPHNQLKGGHHWLGFTGGRLNLSRVDAALLGKTVGPNPPADGEEPESDDSVLVFGTNTREFDSEKEAERELRRWEKRQLRSSKHPEGVDDFIDDPFADKYARWVLLHMRQPGHGYHYEEFMKGHLLFCSFEGKRYRVTMASRLGDIGIGLDFERDAGYDERVHVDECTDWGAEP